MSATQQTPNLPTEEVKEPLFTINELPDGGLEAVVNSTGERFPAKDERDLNNKLLQAKLDTSLSWREQKQQIEQLTEQLRENRETQERLAAALQPPTPAPTPEELNATQLREWMLNEQAKGFGLGSGNELIEQFKSIKESTEQMRMDRLEAAFYQACPEFPGTDEALAKVGAWLDENGIPRQRATLANLKSAHASCVQYNQYKPLTQEQLDAQYANRGRPQAALAARPEAPPTLPTGQPEMTATTDLWSKTPAEIQKMYFDHKARGGQ